MALYAIGDTHLSLGADKPMDVFGGNWEGYVEKLRAGFARVAPEDTVVLCGDLSWGMSLPQAREDFAFLDALPGKKYLLKGNHDYWWGTAAKMNAFFAECGFNTLHILHNNCGEYGDLALCGTRGWFYEEDRGGHNEKVFNRELVRLEASLRAAGERQVLLLRAHPEQSDGGALGRGRARPPPRHRMRDLFPGVVGAKSAPLGTPGGGGHSCAALPCPSSPPGVPWDSGGPLWQSPLR